jgi:hypothetical protein
VRNIYVIHVNNQYVRQGQIEADKITHTEDVTDKVRSKGDLTAKYMLMALSVAQLSKMPDPAPELAKLGSKKDWLNRKYGLRILCPSYSTKRLSNS